MEPEPKHLHLTAPPPETSKHDAEKVDPDDSPRKIRKRGVDGSDALVPSPATPRSKLKDESTQESSPSRSQGSWRKQSSGPDKEPTTGTERSPGKSDGGRERLKRHRVEVAGRVWVPDMWGQEGLLKDWIDCSAFDACLVPGKIMLARAALMEERRRANSGGGIISQ